LDLARIEATFNKNEKTFIFGVPGLEKYRAGHSSPDEDVLLLTKTGGIENGIDTTRALDPHGSPETGQGPAEENRNRCLTETENESCRNPDSTHANRKRLGEVL
jgi:hypothetical protein